MKNFIHGKFIYVIYYELLYSAVSCLKLRIVSLFPNIKKLVEF